MNLISKRLRIIGVGQEWRGDDAAGLLVARRLHELAGTEVAVLENSGAASALLEEWQGAAAVILADAVQGGGRPGEIFRFAVHESPLPVDLFAAASTHAWGLAQAVDLGRVLQQLPPYLTIYGIEGQNFDLGQELSPAVAKAIPEVARRIRLEIAGYLGRDQM